MTITSGQFDRLVKLVAEIEARNKSYARNLQYEKIIVTMFYTWEDCQGNGHLNLSLSSTDKDELVKIDKQTVLHELKSRNIAEHHGQSDYQYQVI